MKPWFTTVASLVAEPDVERPHLMIEAGRAINAASDSLPGVENVILFDLGYDHQATIVALPVPGHRHGQDCGRA